MSVEYYLEDLVNQEVCYLHKIDRFDVLEGDSTCWHNELWKFIYRNHGHVFKLLSSDDIINAKLDWNLFRKRIVNKDM